MIFKTTIRDIADSYTTEQKYDKYGKKKIINVLSPIVSHAAIVVSCRRPSQQAENVNVKYGAK